MRLFHDAQNYAEIAAYQSDLTHSDVCPTFRGCPGMGHHDAGKAQTCSAMHRLREKADLSKGFSKNRV